MFKPIVLLTVYLKQKLFLDGSNVQYFIIPYIILRKLLTNNLFLMRILDYSFIYGKELCCYWWETNTIWKWQPTPVLLPGESHGWKSMVGYSPWDRKQLDTTEWLPHSLTHWEKMSLCRSELLSLCVCVCVCVCVFHLQVIVTWINTDIIILA